MRVHFLGTGAAEGIPNPHCSCQICEEARVLRGKNIRSRTSVIFDGELKVDDPPDAFYHAVRDGINLTQIKDLLMTHTHGDHFNPQDMLNRIEGFAHGVERPLHVYGNDLAVRGYSQYIPADENRFVYHRLIPFKEVRTQTAKVTPLLADHDPDETCFLYFIEKDGKNILYGNDTGWFPEDTWDWLQGRQLDLAILDCTGGFTGKKHSRNHMCIETVREVKRVFDVENMLKENGRIVATHFTHNAGLLHDDFAEALEPYGIEVAYDGLVMDI